MAIKLRIRGGKRTNYPYAVARVQAKRAKLLPPSEYEKLLKMDVSEITRYIEETTYKREVDELAGRFSGLDLLEAALTVNEERAYSAVRTMVDGEGGALVSLFLDRTVVEDLKKLLRGKVAGAGREELLKELLLEDLGMYELFHPLLSDDVVGLEDVLAVMERQGGELGEFARVLADVPVDLAQWEDTLDKAYYGNLVASLKKSKQKGSEAFLELARREVDARNLLNAARWVNAGNGAEDFSPYIIPDGHHLSVALIMNLSRCTDLDAFAEVLSDHPMYEDIREGLEEARRTKRLAPFQTAVSTSMIGQLQRLGHQHPLSIVPILLYLIHKRQEVVTLRTLARGKSAGLSEERLKELVP